MRSDHLVSLHNTSVAAGKACQQWFQQSSSSRTALVVMRVHSQGFEVLRRKAETRATFVAAEHTATCTITSADGVTLCACVVQSAWIVSHIARQRSACVLTDLGSASTSGRANFNHMIEVIHQAEAQRICRPADLGLATRLCATVSDCAHREVKR